jgi:uncharacterized membrane protein YheB (UPF0754 family)
MDWSAIYADVQQNYLIYGSIPIVAAILGYVTKIAAVKMMFYPMKFVGVRPFFGWQGIVPRNALRMASVAVDTITTKLVSVNEVVANLDSERLGKELEGPAMEVIESIIREVMSKHQPKLWESLPNFAQKKLIDRVKKDVPNVIASVMDDIKNNIDEIVDLKALVIRILMKDKHLLNRIFQEVGREEFKFFGVSGLYFGFMIGLVQMVLWILLKEPWILPVFGFLVGFISDWIALNILFEPKKPIPFGSYTIQGLFLKRQKKVAADYARIIASEILTPRAIIGEMVAGPLSERVQKMVDQRVREMVDTKASIVKPFVVMAVGAETFQQMKQDTSEMLMGRLEAVILHAENYVQTSLDIENVVGSKMQAMTPLEFEGLLRPVFKQEEWILIMTGAILGGLVGEGQLLTMIHLGVI